MCDQTLLNDENDLKPLGGIGYDVNLDWLNKLSPIEDWTLAIAF